MSTFRIVSVIFTVVLLFTSCGREGKRTPPSVPEENNRSSTQVPPITVIRNEKPKPKRTLFHIQDIDQRSTTIEIDGDRLVFKKIRQPLVLLYIFSDWCAPCRGMLPYLGDLQKKNAHDLFIIGLLVHSASTPEQVRTLMRRYAAPFFISIHSDNDALADRIAARHSLPDNYPLPLTVLYKNGKYVMQISGAVPYEMLQTLIDQLKDKEKD